MRKHGNEAGEVRKVLHRLCFTAIDIDGVAHGLEGVETDAQGKNHAKERVPLPAFQAERLRQGVIAIDAKIEVLEEAKDRQVQDYG